MATRTEEIKEVRKGRKVRETEREREREARDGGVDFD